MLQQFVEFFRIGGWVMIAISVCSVVALALFLERLWVLRRKRVLPHGLFIEVEDRLLHERLQDAVVVCKKDNSPLARVLLAGIMRAGSGREAMKEAVEDAGRRETASLKKYIGVIGTVASLAPLLGLLGTVSGMIRLFSDISMQEEIRDIGVLADGIYKALYTTAAGLTVAIPALVFYKVLLSKVDGLVLNMEVMCLKLLDMVVHKER